MPTFTLTKLEQILLPLSPLPGLKPYIKVRRQNLSLFLISFFFYIFYVSKCLSTVQTSFTENCAKMVTT